jgi:hypothetical protein
LCCRDLGTVPWVMSTARPSIIALLPTPGGARMAQLPLSSLQHHARHYYR